MGKDLKNKNLEKGITQRKDSYYVGRFTTCIGKRKQKIFKDLSECREWLADSRYEDKHSNLSCPEDMTVDAWHYRWINVKEQTVRPNTVRNYRERYETDIRSGIGNLLLKDVKPVHCQEILNRMADKYRSSTITQTRTTLENMFDGAVQNDLILKNPAQNLKSDIGLPSKPSRVLSRDEQRQFISAIPGHRFEWAFRFALQTGVRCGELTGLKWSDIDWDRQKLRISRTMEHRHGQWKVGDPKSRQGHREIPLTTEAMNILEMQKKRNAELKVVPMKWPEFVFLNESGEPVKNGTYHTALKNICDRNHIEHFSMHSLRHTFAARCIEAGMIPKTLQTILGHANINITMNLYVHTTDDEKRKEMEMVSDALLAV